MLFDSPGRRTGMPLILREPSALSPEPTHSVSPVALTNFTRSPATASELLDITTIRPAASTVTTTNAALVLVQKRRIENEAVLIVM
ncbi:hypothetical protein Xph01_01650 [Micromonospora phaseoli]|nr:hypothetical protein Xph01_01650 [Micromonospora phaseoli]